MRIEKSVFVIGIIMFSLIAIDAKKTRVAIIGSGIAGASSGYYLMKAFNSNPKIYIDYHERENRAGGRTYTVEPDIENGAWFYVPQNLFLVQIANDFNLTQTPINTDYAIFKHKELIPLITQQDLINRFGLPTVQIFEQLTNQLITVVNAMESALTAGDTFDTIYSLLNTYGIADVPKVTTQQYFASLGMNPLFYTEYAAGAGQVFSNQRELNAFFGLVTTVANVLQKVIIADGNEMLTTSMLDWLLDNTNTKIRLDSQIQSILPGNKRRFSIKTNKKTFEYDIVIIACNLRNSKIYIDPSLLNDFNPNTIHLPNTMEVTHVIGNLSTKFFKVPSNFVFPALVLPLPNMEPNLSGIWLEPGNLIRTYSLQPLTAKDFKIFAPGYQVIETYFWDFPWPLFPVVENVQSLPPFQLSQNLFYVNNVEEIADFMEFKAMSARNIVNMIKKTLIVN